MVSASIGSMRRTTWNPRLLLLLECVLALFVVSRLYVLTRLYDPIGDVPQYAEYYRDYEKSAGTNESFYEFHTSAVYSRLAEVQPAWPPTVAEWRSVVEYPPLALSWIVFAPRMWLGMSGGAETPVDIYHVFYRRTMAVVDVGAFLLLVLIVLRLFKVESPERRTFRLLLYIAFGSLLGYLLYDRLDLLVGATILLSLGLLLSRAHFAWSFVVLALGINLKIVPVVLAPLWILAALPPSVRIAPGTRRQRRETAALIASRVCWLLVPAALCFVVQLRLFGDGAFGFLWYQSSRGLEIGSMYASVLLILRQVGFPAQTVFEFGACALRSRPATLLSFASFGVALVCLATAFLLFARKTLHRSENDPVRGDIRLIHAAPHQFVACTVLLLMVFITTSKVASPQFVLWLVPLIPLVRIGDRAEELIWLLFAGVCGTTAVIWPWLFHSDVMGSSAVVADSIVCTGPTGTGVALMVGRNALLTSMTVVLFINVIGRKTEHSLWGAQSATVAPKEGGGA